MNRGARKNRRMEQRGCVPPRRLPAWGEKECKGSTKGAQKEYKKIPPPIDKTGEKE